MENAGVRCWHCLPCRHQWPRWLIFRRYGCDGCDLRRNRADDRRDVCWQPRRWGQACPENGRDSGGDIAPRLRRRSQCADAGMSLMGVRRINWSLRTFPGLEGQSVILWNRRPLCTGSVVGDGEWRRRTQEQHASAMGRGLTLGMTPGSPFFISETALFWRRSVSFGSTRLRPVRVGVWLSRSAAASFCAG